jgi:glyoxylase-like metal-dependent hydrolase (beta-lactamase superfamily II)
MQGRWCGIAQDSLEKETKECAIVDSVLEFRYNNGATTIVPATKVLDFISKNNLKVKWILETHAHAGNFRISS